MIILFLIFLLLIGALGSQRNDNKVDEPTISWWTDRLYPHLEVTEKRIRCSKGHCLSTKKKYNHAGTINGYLFYGSDLEIEDLPLPRNKNDFWALIHEESPMNNYLFSHSTGIKLFNYTSTFRRESDYPLTTQFIPSLGYLVNREPYPLKEKNVLRKKGFAPVLYVQSHCNVASDRDRYIRKLSKFINVDSYGVCLHNRDLPQGLASTDQYESEPFLQFISQYKFHLAFENAICDDYMTEKLFRTLHVGSVPIYKGSPKANDWMPQNKSLILVDDFESPKHLADYLIKLDGSDVDYNSYLKYKLTKEIENDMLREVIENRNWGINDLDKVDFIQGFECYFCDRMIEYKQSKLISDSSSVFPLSKIADKSHMGCPQPHPSLEVKLPPSDEWIQQSWVDSYWFGLDTAMALHEMIIKGENNSSNINQYLLSMRYSH